MIACRVVLSREGHEEDLGSFSQGVCIEQYEGGLIVRSISDREIVAFSWISQKWVTASDYYHYQNQGEDWNFGDLPNIFTSLFIQPINDAKAST